MKGTLANHNQSWDASFQQTSSIHIPPVRPLSQEEMAARVSAATEWAEKVAEEGPGALAKPPDAVTMVLDEHEGSSSEDTSDEAYQKMHQPMEVDEHNRLLGLTGGSWGCHGCRGV